MDLPYLTREFPGVGGTLKRRPEDFFVQEIPLYEPVGEGEHVYCETQKVNLTTFEAVSRLARALGVPARSVGYAGLKDARAVTRQLFSVVGTTPERVMTLGLPDLRVLWAARHGNKLRLGHLKGNRFAIKIRDVRPTDVLKLKPAIDLIKRRGMPNYFGEQRFGRRGDNDVLGAALVRGDDAGVLKQLLGAEALTPPPPSPGTPGEGWDEGSSVLSEQDPHPSPLPEYREREQSASLGGMERAVLARLHKTGNPTAAVKSIDEKIRKLWVSALQSRLFND